jgi:hypothetical protein
MHAAANQAESSIRATGAQITCVRPSLKLPAGFRTRRIEVTVKGACASCAQPMGKKRDQGIRRDHVRAR